MHWVATVRKGAPVVNLNQFLPATTHSTAPTHSTAGQRETNFGCTKRVFVWSLYFFHIASRLGLGLAFFFEAFFSMEKKPAPKLAEKGEVG